MYPSRSNFLLQKFDEATERPYAYLLVDLNPTTPDSLRLRTDVLGTGIEKEKDEEEEEKAEEEGVWRKRGRLWRRMWRRRRRRSSTRTS
jgi:hypothetical protein